MLTLKVEEKLINRLKSLSEIELESVFSELAEHMRKNKLTHIAENAFNSESIDELEHELSETKEELSEKESEFDDLRGWCDDAMGILDSIDPDGDPDEIRDKIQKAIDKIS